MELFTLDRRFLLQDIIDTFNSAIWTERYYGDSDVEIHVPATPDKIAKLKEGTFLGLAGSDEIMILETQEIKDGVLKVTGKSLLEWLNNRFIRTSALHEDRYWYLNGVVPGYAMAVIVQEMCIDGQYLNGITATGISYPQTLKIPGLTLGSYDTAGVSVNMAIPFGPVYDATKEIATTYQIGQQIILESANEVGYSLKYRNYRGLDRTSGQVVRPPVRFSPEMDSLTDIKELRSLSNFKTLVYTFAPANPEGLATVPGSDSYIPLGEPGPTGFDLRALQVFCEDITNDASNPLTAPILVSILNSRAKDELTNHYFIRVVDGEIVPTAQFKYGIHYSLGDIVELRGNSEIVQTARVIEYIRAQDETGEKAYPTVSIMD